MAKITLDNIVSGFSLSKINANFQKIATELNNKVWYRDNPTGESNTPTGDIDMNGKRLYNLPAPTSMNEPLRLQDIKNKIPSGDALSIALASSVGSGLVGFQAPSGPIETVYINLIQKRRISSAAVGMPNATAVIQAQIDALPDGCELDGLGGNYNVTSLNLKSKMRMIDANLTTVAGSTDMVSPITIDGRTSAKSRIELRGIRVNGNRSNQTAVGLAGLGEDGGRHGFRIVGSVSDLLIENSEAINCASDGLELYRAGASISDAVFAFQNITIRDFKATGNRRHGMSADSMRRFKLINAYLNDNGLDLNTVDPLDHGARGARNGGLYGNGIDLEGYGLGSNLDDVLLENVVGLGNIRSGILFYDTVSAASAGFVARKNIRILGGHTDSGIDGSSSGYGLIFTSTTVNKSLGAIYRNVLVDGLTIDGAVLLRAVDCVSLDGGTVNTPGPGTTYATLDYATNVTLDTAPVGEAKGVYAASSTYSNFRKAVPVAPAVPTLTFRSGTTGTLALTSTTLIEDKGNGHFVFLINAKWTAGTASGNTTLNLLGAAGSQVASIANVVLLNNSTGGQLSAVHNLGAGYIIFTNNSIAEHAFQIAVDVKLL